MASDYVNVTLSRENLSLLRSAVRHAANDSPAMEREVLLHLLFLLHLAENEAW